MSLFSTLKYLEIRLIISNLEIINQEATLKTSMAEPTYAVYMY